MSKVYFKAIENLDEDLINKISYEMMTKIIKEENIVLNNIVPLKVHFGEPGNPTFIKPNYFDGIKRYLKENDIESCYMDTNVLYKGRRAFTDEHIKTAHEHGFTDLEVVIADGDKNSPYDEIPVNLKFCKTCKIGKKYSEYNNYIILAHFKGHGIAGFGGAIKQLAMGFASRAGKLQQHSNIVPIINDKCISCGACVNICPVNAIELVDGKAVINPDICIGCASCILVCPVDAIENTWTDTGFHEKLAEYAYAATRGKTNIYFNYAFNITADCDCFGKKMEIVAPNIGIFISTDPVAIDQASLDIVQKITDEKKFDDARRTLDYAEKIGLGSKTYELIEM